jgi:hypothetical protein
MNTKRKYIKRLVSNDIEETTDSIDLGRFRGSILLPISLLERMNDKLAEGLTEGESVKLGIIRTSENGKKIEEIVDFTPEKEYLIVKRYSKMLSTVAGKVKEGIVPLEKGVPQQEKTTNELLAELLKAIGKGK